MGILDMVTNTVEGLVEASVGAAKTTVGAVVAPLDDGKTFDEGVDGVVQGMEKVGKTGDRDG